MPRRGGLRAGGGRRAVIEERREFLSGGFAAGAGLSAATTAPLCALVSDRAGVFRRARGCLHAARGQNFEWQCFPKVARAL